MTLGDWKPNVGSPTEVLSSWVLFTKCLLLPAPQKNNSLTEKGLSYSSKQLQKQLIIALLLLYNSWRWGGDSTIDD